jgi:hypothetical protein
MFCRVSFTLEKELIMDGVQTSIERKPDVRCAEAKRIKLAYELAEMALRDVGCLLRTTEAGHYCWASSHKSAITGLRVVLEKLRDDVPTYEEA